MNFKDPARTRNFVRQNFQSNPKRLQHIFKVAELVQQDAEIIAKLHPTLGLNVNDAVCAALLHDIGYAAAIELVKFHPWDGYHFLKKEGHLDLAELIVGHSCSPEEAELLGHPPIHPSDRIEAKLITYWDMRVKQGGMVVTYKERLADIIFRYGKKSVVGQANLEAQPRLEIIFEEIEKLKLSPTLPTPTY